MRNAPELALIALLALAPLGCEGDMVRDAGGGQDDSSSPGRPVDDGSVDGRTLPDAGPDTGPDSEADPSDGAADAAGDGATDGSPDEGPDGGDGGADAGDGGADAAPDGAAMPDAPPA